MLTLLGLTAVTLVPVLVVVALLSVAERVQRRRALLAARQVAVTDAIHRELGPVVAPVAQRRGLTGWELRIAVPAERPDLVAATAATARCALARLGDRAADSVPIVLVARRLAR